MYVSLVFGWMTWLLGPGLDIPLVVPGTDMDTVSCASSVMDLGTSPELGPLTGTLGPGSDMETCVLESGGPVFRITETLSIVVTYSTNV